MDRNNTSFPVQLLEELKRVDVSSETIAPLKYYQALAKTFFVDKKFNIGTNGLLVYHMMGLGKTILASSIAMEMNKHRHVIVLLAKSLQDNFRNGIVKYMKLKDPSVSEESVRYEIREKLSFVTMNASNMMTQLKIAASSNELTLDKKLKYVVDIKNLDGKLLIIDEAHNFFRAITNGSKNALDLYELIINSNDLKLLFLTGTPISNHPFELCAAYNMLSGDRNLMPESWSDFEKYFINSKTQGIKNKEKFQNRILGLTSYVTYNDASNVVESDNTKSQFPEELPVIIEKIPMSEFQYARYVIARDKEMEENVKFGFDADKPQSYGTLQKPKSEKSSTYRVKSRQMSNFAIGKKMDFSKKHNVEKLKDAIAKKGVNSSKMEKIIENISKSPGMALVYSQFLEYGLFICSKYLEREGYKRLSIEGLEKDLDDDKRFLFITGEVKPEHRTTIQQIINSENNKHGEKIKILLVSSTGAEGLDLKNFRQCHIMEPYWNRSRLDQVKTRVIRYMSHIALEPEERNVQVYIYLSDHAENATEGQKKHLTTDIELYKRSIDNGHSIDTFLQAIQETSIECNYVGRENCVRCNPTGQKIYYPNLVKDMKLPNACQVYNQKKVKAKELIFNDKKYYYVETDNPEDVFKYKIYQFDEGLNVYTAVDPSTDLFKDILATLE